MKTASLDGTVRDFLVKAGVMGLLEKTGLKAPLGLAWRCVRSPGTARHELDVLRDYWSFKQKYGSFLGKGAHLADPAKKVLIVSLTDWVAQVKAESMLAKALQLRGLSPVVLTYRHCGHALGYFRLFGFADVVYLDALGSRVEDDAISRKARSHLDQLTTFPSLMGFQYRGVYVGRHVLSTICRTLRQGTPDLARPDVRELLRRLLPVAMQTVARAERLISRLQPQMALFLERGYTPYGEVYDVAINAGVNTIQWLGSHVNESLVLRRCTDANRHDHPFSLADETWEELRRMPWTPALERELQREFEERYKEGAWFNRQRLQDGKRMKDLDEIRQQLGLDPNKKTVVVFSHLLWDATFFYGEDVFSNYEEWLVETVKAACRNPRVNWIIKLHPANVWKLRRKNVKAEFVEEVVLRAKVGELPAHVRLLRPDTDINTYSFFQLMDYCLTVRGTIGMEAPCYGIPVLTAGTGRYSGRGFTINSRHRGGYLGRLAQIDTIPRLGPSEVQLARKHAYALFKLRPLEFSAFRLLFPDGDSPSHPLDHNVQVNARSFEELEAASDLRTFAEWAIESKRLDFMNPIPG